ncbi:C-type lectin domain family 4 member K-like isoform X2 [Drosophila innubila]|uniref:C-type lectin domain family 4 member K-like isoform X2 n=1 Tax=Drosophila innubila TaxID=198719 RepID=UPI00148CD99B|nr:C-type lectin domain family 4 member K-like isoform X2 [Drosophila innubila]
MVITNNLISLLIVVMLLLQQSSASCAEWKQLETTCSSYCFKVLRPVLDHTKALQGQVNDSKHQTESLTKLEDPEKLTQERADVYFKRLEQKLEELRKMIVKQHGDFSGKFQSIERELEKIDELEKKLDQILENQNNVIQKRDDNLKQKLDSMAKVENIKQLQDRLNIFEKKFDQKLENIGKSTETTLQKHVAGLTAKLNDLLKVNEVRKKTVRKPFQKIGSKYYYIERTERVNWFVAAHKCLQFGGHLASIQSSSEVSELNTHLQSYSDYWIDINDLGSEGLYISATTGRKASKLYWNTNEPNNLNNNEHCVIHNKNYQMNDDNCNNTKLFICKSESVN